MLIQASCKVGVGRLVRSMGTSPGPGTEMEEMTSPSIFLVLSIAIGFLLQRLSL